SRLSFLVGHHCAAAKRGSQKQAEVAAREPYTAPDGLLVVDDPEETCLRNWLSPLPQWPLITSAASADYYIVQEKATKKCKVVETRTTETTWIQSAGGLQNPIQC
ncbi:MAG: hypothetical protein WCD60_05250, partial [Pseudolabrys sp.]